MLIYKILPYLKIKLIVLQGNVLNLEKEKKFRFKKRFGQNFLTDRKICEKITQKADIDEEYVVEIGPGSGMLTEELLKRAKMVVAIEKDRELIPILEEKFKGEKRLILLNEDFLEVDLDYLMKKMLKSSSFKICANIPYNITSKTVVKILKDCLNVKSATIMVQKEVALRLIANVCSKNYGSISVFVKYFSNPEILFNVLRGSFFPTPKVDSAVVKLIKKDVKTNKVSNEELFFKLVRASFSQKRKKISNPLSQKFNVRKDAIEKILEELLIGKNKRAEQISFEQYIMLANCMEGF